MIQLRESLGINYCQVVGGRVKYKASPSEPLEMPKPTIYILVSMYRWPKHVGSTSIPGHTFQTLITFRESVSSPFLLRNVVFVINPN